ncbi:MAG: phosphotransferase [Acidimicrobiales bacterium]
MSLAELLPGWMGRQRWYAGAAPSSVVVVHDEEIVPGMRWLMVDADGARYQLMVGLRRMDDAADFLQGRDHEVIGQVDGMLAFDALADPDLARAILDRVLPGEETSVVRPVGAEQSNTSLVFDDRLILKVFRRLHHGPNPDIEVTAALVAAGFEQVAQPLGVWRHEGTDLAACMPYLSGGAEGWALALTSLRDLYATACDDPADCGGDFAAEARRLGEVTAGMHLALASAFGSQPGDPGRWAEEAWGQVHRLPAGVVAGGTDVHGFLARLRTVGVATAGASVRLHGDYHLGQVMRTDAGWFVLDFEGEPARPLDQRRLASSPLKDVAGMLRSFDYAARFALRERDEAEREGHGLRADAWEARNRVAFLRGYEGTDGIDALLPPAGPDRDTVRAVFELDKAVYEVLYEQAHRPDWVDIPTAAVRRLLSG